MKKRLLAGLTAAVLAAVGTVLVCSADSGSKVIVMTIDNPVMTVDGEEVNIDESGTSPVIINGRTLVPIRAVAEALGAEVSWNDETKEITITAADNTAEEKTVETAAETVETEQNEEASEGKILTVYFSMPEDDEVDAVSSASKVVADGELYGSVEYLANTVQKTAGGDIFRIETVREYPSDHEELVDLADNELRSNERPELASSIENFDEYDTVFVGYPIWWGDMPMAVYSFFDEYDFSGKTIIPFSSHGGSRL
ncbi:MAG: flavodoxin [Eubacterium sp.]|nr:flavodoxin [Eubacterium sp.]